MAELRTGKHGTYYGSPFTESESLTAEQMEHNAYYILEFFIDKGWTKYAVAGILGNMQAESSLNPGRWQSENVGNTSGGYGLVQWTPATKYFDWINEQNLDDASEMDNNLARIIYELENGLQWIATDEYNLSFEEFSKSTESAEYLASAFLKCYERAGVEVEETRRSNAANWLALLNEYPGDAGDDSGSGSSNKRKFKGFKFHIFKRRKKVSY